MQNKKPTIMIDDTGRIILPIEVTQAMEWGNGSPLEIWLNKTDNEVVLKRHNFVCVFCGGTRDLTAVGRKRVCASCRYDIICQPLK